MKRSKTCQRSIAFLLSIALLIPFAPTLPAMAADPLPQVVTIDGDAADTNPANTFKGYGLVSANNTSRLLLDYKEEHPDRYWEIMNRLFNQDTGAGINHIKVEMGNDSNTSSGTEPATKRSADEPANVRRGAGYIFAADAKTINPTIKVSILRWTQPNWVQPWSDGNTDPTLATTIAAYERMYKWYKDTAIAIRDTYGYDLDYINPDRNETGTPNVNFVKWFAGRMRSDAEFPNYNKIRIVASDENTTLNIPNRMLADADLMAAVDVMAYHYNLATSDNYLKVNGENNKEVWYSEGVAPQTPSKYRANSSQVFGGVASALDVAGRFIGMYTQGRRTHYMFQPAVASFYSGAPYSTKEIIAAKDPWSGYYAPDVGIQTVQHFSQFAAKDWMYIPNASSGVIGSRGNSEMDGNAAGAEFNRLAFVSPDKKDYSVVMVNDSDRMANFQFNVKKNIFNAGNPVQVWETRGPDAGQEYDANWYKQLTDISPADNGDVYTYTLTVKPHSMVSLTSTANNPNTNHARAPYVRDTNIPTQAVLDVPSSNPALIYEDDFEYSDYPAVNGLSYIERRGGTPRYTADQGGAFEVYTGIGKDGTNGLKQMIFAGNRPGTWATTPFSYTVLGDERWANYEASIDFKMDRNPAHTGDNYVAMGVRHKLNHTTADSESGYKFRIYADGNWRLIRLNAVVATGSIAGFDADVWHRMSVKAVNQVVTASVDGKTVTSYMDPNGILLSGQVMIQSSLHQPVFDNLKVEAVNGYVPYHTERVDDLDSRVVYQEGSFPWAHSLSGGFGRINRTITTGGATITPAGSSTTIEGTPNRWYLVRNEGNTNPWGSNSSNAWAGDNGSYASLTFYGTGIAVYGIGQGTNSVARMDVYLDDLGTGYNHDTTKRVLTNKAYSNGTTSQLIYQVSGLAPGKHNVKVVKTAAASGTGNSISIEKAVVTADSTTPSYLELPFTGTGFTLAGDTGSATIDVYVDNLPVGQDVAIAAIAANRSDTYSYDGLTNGPHTLKVVVKSGSFSVDSIDIKGAVYGTVTKTALGALITQVSSYNEADYVVSDWTVFSNALAAAQTVMTDPTAVQYSVDYAMAVLQSGADALRLKKQPVAVTGAYAAVVATKVGEPVTGLPNSIKVTLADGTADVDADIIWLNNTAARFMEPYSMVQVQGQIVGGKNLLISVQVEVVPDGLVYFIDPGVSGDVITPPYTAIKNYVGNGLLNDRADQPSTGDTVWGHTPTDTNYKYKAMTGAVVATDKGQTGIYGSDTRNSPLVYVLPLTAGKYTVTSFHRDWWNNSNRTMDLILSYKDAAGNPVTETARSGLIAGPDGTKVSYSFILPVDGTVKYSVNNTWTGNQAALISYLGVVKTSSDVTKPIITLTGDATVNLFANGAGYTDAGATAADDQDGSITDRIVKTITYNGNLVPAISTVAAATYTYHYNVSDAAGNAAVEVTRTVVVAEAPDTTKPVITLIGDAAVNLLVGASYTDAGVTAADNRDGSLTDHVVTTVTYNGSIVPGISTVSAATYMYHYNVSDAAGNAAVEVTRTINVSLDPDITKPVITLIGDATVNLANGSGYTDAGAAAADDRDGSITDRIVQTITYNGSIVTAINTAAAGTYTYHYNASDTAGNAAAEVTRTVIVAPAPDAAKPVITLVGDAAVNLANGAAYTDAGATAADDRDGSISDRIVTTITHNGSIVSSVNTAVAGIYKYHYNVSDTAGNAAAEVTRTVIVASAPDTTKPVITLVGDGTVNLANGAGYTDAGAAAADDRDGSITDRIVTTITHNGSIVSSINTAAAGTYTYHYNVSDAAGNAAAEVTRMVIVGERNDPAPEPTTSPEPTKSPEPTSTQVLGREDFETSAAGTVSARMSDNKESVLLPSNLSEIVGANSLRLVKKDMTIEFSGAALKNILGAVNVGQDKGAQINFSAAAAPKDVAAGLIHSGINRSVQLATASEVYDFNLHIVAADGTKIPVTTLAESVTLSFKVDPNADPDLLGVYEIAEDGTLQYKGGTLVDGTMTVQVNHLNQFAVLEYNKLFSDVDGTYWGSDGIKKVAAKHIIEGVTETEFNPEGKVTRAEFSAMIARTLGLKTVKHAVSKFEDVGSAEWYAEAVAAAAEAGIILGRSSDAFEPNASITREEMAVMIVRASEYFKGKKEAEAYADSFTDSNQIGEWAQSSVSIAQKAGLINGRDNNQFVPKENMTRAESAQVILNLMRDLK
jgi:hypothetical protein